MDEESRTDPMVEIEAIQVVAGALAGLDESAIKRVLKWAADRFAVTGAVAEAEAPEIEEEPQFDKIESQSFSDVAELYDATTPSNDPEKALVVGYWLQYQEEMPEFDSQKVNTHLKNLGHGVLNITQALTSLKGRKPQLVMQTKKAGTSQQARKKYKLTRAGKQFVGQMLQENKQEPGSQ